MVPPSANLGNVTIRSCLLLARGTRGYKEAYWAELLSSFSSQAASVIWPLFQDAIAGDSRPKSRLLLTAVDHSLKQTLACGFPLGQAIYRSALCHN